MTVYYNEHDLNAVAWLRGLIKQGLIADGVVDERSIVDVQANDLVGFTQCHFFAGIGGWSRALRLANWADNEPVWSASLPCQPFSTAGKQLGKSDERHLLPHFIELVKQCNPRTIFGEQVLGAIKHGWLDDLCLEMERENYAVGQVVLTAAGTGAPHIRQRLYWVADSINQRSQVRIFRGQDSQRENVNRHAGCSGSISGVGNADLLGRERKQNKRSARFIRKMAGKAGSRKPISSSSARVNNSRLGDTELHGCIASKIRQGTCTGKTESGVQQFERSSSNSRMGNSKHNGHSTCSQSTSNVQPSEERRENGQDVSREFAGTSGRENAASLSGCHDGRSEWDNPDWIYCRDNKYRPIEPSIEPLANGLPKGMGYSSDSSAPANPHETQEARVMRLKGYGNAIVPQVAAEFISVFMDVSKTLELKCTTPN